VNSKERNRFSDWKVRKRLKSVEMFFLSREEFPKQPDTIRKKETLYTQGNHVNSLAERSDLGWSSEEKKQRKKKKKRNYRQLLPTI